MSGSLHDWSVVIHEDGRCGKVTYREHAGSLSFYWEFGGGDTVATIQVGDAATWRQQHAWAADNRATILQRVAGEVIRQKAPNCRAEIDDRQGWIYIQSEGTPPPPIPPTQQQFLRVSEKKSKIVFIAAIVIVAVALVVWGAKQALSIRVPHGTPLGDSVRAGSEIATLTQTLEAYVPSLHRDPGKDRYSVSLFLWPVNGSSPGRTIPLAKNLRAQEASWAKLLGGDGRTVWFKLNGIGGLELATGKRIGPDELRAANPNLAETWDDPRRISFEQRLRITLADRSVVEIDPQTLKAAPVRETRAAVVWPSGPQAQDFLCAGVRPSPTEWLGLHSVKEIASDFKPKSRLSRTDDATNAKELRRLHRGELGPELDRGYREILSMTPLSSEEYLNAAFVRAGPGGEPLRLSEPDGFLMIFTSVPGQAGTLVVARVNMDGKLAWRVDTGIDRFKLSQILPDAHFIAFIGPRPPIPDKVSEPILVSIDTRSGAQTTSTLWK